MSESDWQPIEVLDYGKRVLGARYNRRGYWECEVISLEADTIKSDGKRFAATHWMPLPAAPQTAQDARNAISSATDTTATQSPLSGPHNAATGREEA